MKRHIDPYSISNVYLFPLRLPWSPGGTGGGWWCWAAPQSGDPHLPWQYRVACACAQCIEL